MTTTAWQDEAFLRPILREGELEVEGRISDASNTTLRCLIGAGTPDEVRCVYKPVSGERPLWDFPEWTLTRRELAAHELSEAAGWGLVPPTVWRDDGPRGAGMCQLWIDEDHARSQVIAVRPTRVPDGWLHVLDAEDGAGRPVVLAHAPSDALIRMAVFDALANNADRKGGHVITDEGDRVWGIDHGVTFAVEDKLRTVLWGWAGEPLPDSLVSDVERLHDLLGESYDPVDRWLDEEERQTLRHRVRALLSAGRFPLPSGRWPAVPWPVF